MPEMNATSQPALGPGSIKAQTPPPPTYAEQKNENSDASRIEVANSYSTKANTGEVDTGDPETEGVRLMLTWFARHIPDAQMSHASAKLLAKMDAAAGVAHDAAQIRMPEHDVQQNAGHGQYFAVEKTDKSPESVKDAATKLVPDTSTVNTPQVGGLDPLGHSGSTPAKGVPNDVSINPTSVPTSSGMNAPGNKDAKDEPKK